MQTGRFKAKAIKGSEQVGEADNDNATLQVAIDMDLKDSAGASAGSMTTFLYFTQAAAPYSFDRLRALGWKGQSAADLGDLSGIDTNEVDFEITSEQYNGKTVFKGQILSGPSRVNMTKKLDPKVFAAKVAALLGNSGAAAATPGKAPPF